MFSPLTCHEFFSGTCKQNSITSAEHHCIKNYHSTGDSITGKAAELSLGTFAYHDKLERLTESEKYIREYGMQVCHSFGSDCANAWKNPTHT